MQTSTEGSADCCM